MTLILCRIGESVHEHVCKMASSELNLKHENSRASMHVCGNLGTN